MAERIAMIANDAPFRNALDTSMIEPTDSTNYSARQREDIQNRGGQRGRSGGSGDF
jgi:hypothetical protein